MSKNHTFQIGLCWCLATLIFLLLSSCSDPDAQLKPLTSPSTILAFGDSLTFGTGAARLNSYPEMLQRRIGIEVINAGVPGEISSKGKVRLGRLLDLHKPALVILCHGGNDMIKKLGEQQLKENLRSMINNIQAQGSQLILLAVPKPGVFLKPAGLYKEIAEEFSIPLEEKSLSEIISKPGLKSDPIHPNDKGYQVLADNIADLLVETGAITALYAL